MAFYVDAGSRSFSDHGLHIKSGVDDVDATLNCSALIKSSSCDLTEFFSEEDINYNNSFIHGSSYNKVQFNRISSIYHNKRIITKNHHIFVL